MVLRIVTCCLLVMCIAAFQSCEDTTVADTVTGPIDLKFNLYADSTYRYSIKNNIAITQEIDKDNSIAINQNMTLVSSYKVVSITPETRRLSVTYERITMSSGNEVFSLDYDSENDNGTDIMYEDLRNLIDKSFKMTVSDRGEIVSSEPIIKGKSEGSGAYKVNDSSIRKILIHALQLYPGREVNIGDIWENTYTTSIGFANVRVKNKYQLKSINNGFARIELQGRLSTDKAEQAQNSNMKLDGMQDGTFDVVISSGLVQNGKITQQLTGEMNITGTNTPVSVESNIYIMGSIKNQQ